MKEIPILFSGAMVRAILNGSKTQTRRVMKPEPTWVDEAKGTGIAVGGRAVRMTRDDWLHWNGDRVVPNDPRCPYGKPGDRIWVRETTRARFLPNLLTGEPTNARCGEYVADGEAVLNADGFDLAWWYSRESCPAIHMPRAACRLMLEVTDVRVERLNDCSEADAEAEGVAFLREVPDVDETLTARQLYECLWDSINGAGAWEANPWVWVIEFRRINQGDAP